MVGLDEPRWAGNLAWMKLPTGNLSDEMIETETSGDESGEHEQNDEEGEGENDMTVAVEPPEHRQLPKEAGQGSKDGMEASKQSKGVTTNQ